ncbi:hypothetical protein [Wohlfahrtiimonas populi]|uniref:hypothetical protein n=1 Tax=Wohlfahrtiimonas populi TaxID=1940240 RepID=UPI00098D1613|nr:hypothetical protein [Wohlfahrtiimonas populi]
MKKSIEYIDMNNTLRITISNSKPVKLTELTDSLTGIADQYYSYIENDAKGLAESSLYVSEIKKGSMVFELVAQSLPYVSLIAATSPLEMWINQLVKTMEWLSGKGKKPDIDITKKDLQNICKTLSPVANDESSKIQLNLIGCNISGDFRPVFYDSPQAKKIQTKAKKEIALIENKMDHKATNRLMVWYQTRHVPNTKTGDMGIIESISNKPLKIIFANEEDKVYMYNAGKEFDVPWQELGFIVDVDVQYLNGVPKVYNIIKVHKNDTFVLND